MSKRPFTVIVLAGQRDAVDPLAAHAGASCKALVEVGGRPLLLRGLQALKAATHIERILLSGPDAASREGHAELHAACGDRDLQWHAPGPSPSSSAWQLMQTLPPETPVLVTSGDRPFVNTAHVDEFCRRSLAEKADVTIGLAPHALVSKRFPDMHKTVLRFADDGYCGCNLFAFLTPEGRRAADYWRAIENARKSPLKVIRILGWWPLLRYRLGWLSLAGALRLLSKRFGLRIRAVVLPYAEAAIDVDSIEDYEIIQRLFARGTSSTKP